MKTLKTKREIATEINIKGTTTVRLDLAERDDFGLISQKIRIDKGFFSDGTPNYDRATIRAFSDRKQFVFHNAFAGISAELTYFDIEEMIAYANAPIVRPDSDVVLVIVDSRLGGYYDPLVLHVNKEGDGFIPEDKDASMWF